jgi:hypothetical protein
MRWALLLAPLLALLPALPARAADVDAAAERARIARERGAVEADYAARQRDCENRFVVTSCVEAARAGRRQAMDSLRQQEQVLEDAERKQRAAERAELIERKRIEADSRPPPVEPAPPRAPKPAAAASTAPKSGRAASSSGRTEAEEAARRAEASAHRRAAAEQHRAEVERRNEERKAGGKVAAPLPPGPTASAPVPMPVR